MTYVYLILGVASLCYALPYGSLKGEECTLEPSELGPSWYKVPQPLEPTPLPDLNATPSYMHMPCAPTTFFEITICGCTNLVALIHTSLNKRKEAQSDEERKSRIRQGDLVKAINLAERNLKRVAHKYTEESKPGSILLNTRTGEVTKCPFRASRRGHQWYLVRVPGEFWRPMRCAAGTYFSKHKCTCVGNQVPSTVDQDNIVIIEEDFDRFASGSDNTISQSLGISLRDVDFGLNKKEANDIPFWRRESRDQGQSNRRNDIVKNIRADVNVNIQKHDKMIVDRVNLGTDTISESHAQLLLKRNKGRISVISKKKKSRTLQLDKIVDQRQQLTNSFLKPEERTVQHTWNTERPDHSNISKTIFFAPMKPLEKSNTKPKSSLQSKKTSVAIEVKTDTVIGNVHEVNNGIPKGKATDLADLNELTNVLSDVDNKITAKEKLELVSNGNTNKTSVVKDGAQQDKTLFQNEVECRKKPLRELGGQYFLIPIENIGYVPYACYGDQVYDHFLCACRQAFEGEARYNEALFPLEECYKRKIFELGPKYFEGHVMGFGFLPIACHGNLQFDERKCTCV
ncbi:uncharacterized protein LOC128226583 isoform X2 [Mya arenaria]|uniref:uncharacterized protein LOC128226583 isoform X2 n=1 Tax=Mya arenaria TaxID=6604 RepID=UPI0022E77994|nr:uncharacterized protein LOC128226583 isoform X2 [Mya arenaria]